MNDRGSGMVASSENCNAPHDSTITPSCNIGLKKQKAAPIAGNGLKLQLKINSSLGAAPDLIPHQESAHADQGRTGGLGHRI